MRVAAGQKRAGEHELRAILAHGAYRFHHGQRREVIRMATHRMRNSASATAEEPHLASLSCERTAHAAQVGSGGMSLDDIYAMFPISMSAGAARNAPVRRRAADAAMARILRSGATCCCSTRSPRACTVIVQKLGLIIRQLKETGFTIVLAEQNFHFAAPLADRMYMSNTARSRRRSPGEMVAKKELLQNTLELTLVLASCTD